MKNFGKTLTAAGLAATVAFIVASARTGFDARQNAEKARQAEISGKTQDAIRWWQRAFQQALFFQSTKSDARASLERIAQKALDSGDNATALESERAIRRGLLRRYWSPSKSDLDPVDQKIGSLIGESWNRHKEDWRQNRPNRIWAFLSIIGLIVNFFAVGGLCLVACDKEGRFIRGTLKKFSALWLAGISLWLLGLFFA